MRVPRVAYFPDSFHEVNGVAHTSRNFQAYAHRKGLPFLCVRAGSGGAERRTEGSVTTLELGRSRAAVPMEMDLSFDPLFWRHAEPIEEALSQFQPDVLHLTGPSELGMFAAYYANRLGIPLAASWHTNIHEYAGRRARWLARAAQESVEAGVLEATLRFYRLAGMLYAPNDTLCDLLQTRTGKPCRLMRRGVDTDVFRPAPPAFPDVSSPELHFPGTLTVGYVGRLSVEKNVALLVKVAEVLRATGLRARLLIVGQGEEEADLRAQLAALQVDAEFAGVLRGAALADAYRRMDLFCFPSHTDTFGNVVLEALASGVPAVVTPNGGPRSIVQHGVTGMIAEDADFGSVIAGLLQDPSRLHAMSAAARVYALGCSWDAVFDSVYAGYAEMLGQTSAG